MTKTELLKIAKPILFNGEMVRALLDGRKTVTRRVVKNASPEWEFEDWCDCAVQTIIDRNGNEQAKEVDGLWATFCATDEYIESPMIKAKYQVGDILYVRETWQTYIPHDAYGRARPQIFIYRADCHPADELITKVIWRPSIHMPKEAARIFLRVKSVRVERVRDITETQAINEGVLGYHGWQTAAYKEMLAEARANGTKPPIGFSPRQRFAHLWNSTIKAADLPLYGWEANPWVWVYDFERIQPE